MSTAWLCQIDAFTRVGGTATTIRLASHDDDRLCHLNAQTWWPAIARLPTLAYDFFDGAFGGEIVTPSGRAELSIEAAPGFTALMLHGARIRWYSGTLGAAWGDYVLRFDGLIDNHPAIRDGVAAIDFRVDDRWLDDPILATYAGTTGAEGDAAQKGQVKPLLLGAPRFVEGVLIDTIDTIVQLNDGPIAGVDVAFESAARFAPSAGDYANYAALDAATIAPGFYATCLAGGYVRHGAPPDGLLTYHVQGSNAGGDGGGQVRRAGAMIKRIAARLGHSAKVDAAGLTAIDSARPWDLSVPLTSQTTLRELAQSLAQSINAVALVTWTGLLTMLPIDPPEGATPVGTLASDGTALPPVARVDQLGIAPPWWRTAIEAEVTHRVHGYDEVRFTAKLVPVGIYDSGTTYREGNIASIADGSRWLYTSATPTTGNAPPTWPTTSNGFWENLSPPIDIAPPTDRSAAPPLELPRGTIWFDDAGHPYRFGSRPWIGGDGSSWIGADGTPWLGGGYEDIQDQVGPLALDLAELADGKAEAAITDAADAQARIAAIVADGTLDKSEKPDIVLRYNAILSEQAGIQNNADYYVITTEKTAYNAAVAALTAYLTGLSPAYDDYIVDTPVDRDAFNATFKTFYDARQALLDKIAVEAGRSTATMVLAPTKFIACDYLGVPKSSDSFVLPNLRKRGNARVDAVSTWSATIPSVVTGSIDTTSGNNDRGDITVTALSSGWDTAEIIVTSSNDGIELTGKITLACVRDAPPPPPPPSGTGATSAQSSEGQTNSTASYLSSGVIIGPVRCGSSGNIKLEALLTFSRALDGENNAYGKWGYATSGSGPFTDTAGGEVISSIGCYRGNTGGAEPVPVSEDGILQVIETVTGLTSGSDYWFEFRPRKGTTFDGSTSAVVTFSGLKKATQL